MNEVREAQAFDQTLAGKWGLVILFVGFSALEIWALFSGVVTLAHWKGWLIAGGAVFFPIMALWSAIDLTRDSRLIGIARHLATAIKWLLALPFVLVAVAFIGWLLYQAAGWLATIPSWAAVIIVLLLLIYSKRDTRA
ncbi:MULTISPECIES: hypothetical protein [Rhodanobacter]|uniref:hypothetical protein n=1 Tax=Rhodanobacter TaxID=75309 RepID=UPI0005688B7F|nr:MULTISPECIES: hypothetical protein [Rhodanobacter]KZC20689.1 hypothetical protein RHOFW104R3_24300 [Rhodanobacter denitrificans]UJJ51036.1 hypothetical protein LRK52_17665 [Rhodanobacter denitrificans]UJM93782.1 hypothetical protein LRK32_17740 [Rhodanobacter denitrificans]UJM97313.1 hypothetical protein LRK44_17750 [Rhodanobacter denitrificans]UJN23272.1 hypothetical protein LRK54_08885 [Rhodanobacter denitrificans]